MVRTVRIAALVASLVALSAIAHADDDFARPGWYVGLGGVAGVNFFEDEIEDKLRPFGIGVDVNTTWGLNARVGYRFLSWLALEGMYEYMDDFSVDVKSVSAGGAVIPVGASLFEYRTHTPTVNLKLILPTWRFQPYLLLGLGGQYYDINASSASESIGLDFSETGWSFAGRPAAGIDIYLTRSIVLNAELAGVLAAGNLSTIPDVGDFFYISAGGGLQWRF